MSEEILTGMKDFISRGRLVQICALSALLTVSVVILADNAIGASFDCSKAQYPIEKLICADEELSHWDGQVAKVYKQVRSKVDAQSKKLHLSEQRAFLKQRYDKCNVPRRGEMPFDQALRARTCLVDLYKERNAKLSMVLLKKQKSERRDAAVNPDLKPPMGELVISDVRWSGMSALTDEEARQHFGKVMDVREYHLFSPFHDGEKCYLTAPERLSLEDFEYEFRARRAELGIEGQSIVHYEYVCASSGASVLVANDGDLILSLWDGGYFVLSASSQLVETHAEEEQRKSEALRKMDEAEMKAEVERKEREQTIAAKESETQSKAPIAEEVQRKVQSTQLNAQANSYLEFMEQFGRIKEQKLRTNNAAAGLIAEMSANNGLLFAIISSEYLEKKCQVSNRHGIKNFDAVYGAEYFVLNAAHTPTVVSDVKDFVLDVMRQISGQFCDTEVDEYVLSIYNFLSKQLSEGIDVQAEESKKQRKISYGRSLLRGHLPDVARMYAIMLEAYRSNENCKFRVEAPGQYSDLFWVIGGAVDEARNALGSEAFEAIVWAVGQNAIDEGCGSLVRGRFFGIYAEAQRLNR